VFLLLLLTALTVTSTLLSLQGHSNHNLTKTTTSLRDEGKTELPSGQPLPSPLPSSTTDAKNLIANHKPKHKYKYHCGNNTEQAIALGCRYDALAAHWMHPACSNVGTEEFVNLRPNQKWRYWHDQEATNEILTTEELSRSPTYWTTTREHLSHCLFILRRAQYLLATGQPPDSLTASLSHADHCTGYVLKQVGLPDEKLDEVATLGYIGFLAC
jgi:hypothetical protein